MNIRQGLRPTTAGQPALRDPAKGRKLDNPQRFLSVADGTLQKSPAQEIALLDSCAGDNSRCFGA